MLAKDIYSQHFRAAQAVPRGVVAKLCAVVRQLEAACEKHTCQVSAVIPALLYRSAKCRKKRLAKQSQTVDCS